MMSMDSMDDSSGWCYSSNSSLISIFISPGFDTAEVKILSWCSNNLDEAASSSADHREPVSLSCVSDHSAELSSDVYSSIVDSSTAAIASIQDADFSNSWSTIEVDLPPCSLSIIACMSACEGTFTPFSIVSSSLEWIVSLNSSISPVRRLFG